MRYILQLTETTFDHVITPIKEYLAMKTGNPDRKRRACSVIAVTDV